MGCQGSKWKTTLLGVMVYCTKENPFDNKGFKWNDVFESKCGIWFLDSIGKYPLDKKGLHMRTFIYRMRRFPFGNIEHYIILYCLARRKHPTRC